MRDDGSLCNVADGKAFAEKHGIPFVTLPELVAYRRRLGAAAEVPAGAPHAESESKMWIDDIAAECKMRVWKCADPTVEIITLTKGDVDGVTGVPVRVHSECFTGDILGSKRCDCGLQLHKFLRVMNGESRGILIYIRGHEGRGIGLSNKIRAYDLQDQGLDTVDANLRLGLPVDTRNYEDCLGVLQQLGVRSVKLFTNNPDKSKALGSMVSEVAAIASVPNEHSMKYLRTKLERMAHKTVLDTFQLPTPTVDLSKFIVGIVHTTWNDSFVGRVVEGVESALSQRSVRAVKLTVPGAADLVGGCRAMIRRERPHAVVALGMLIKGSSDMYDVSCMAVMSALTSLNASQDTPIVSGLLMCRDETQADERTKDSKLGPALAESVIHMATLAEPNDEAASPEKRRRL
jgi:GTP cyclohydrolase II